MLVIIARFSWILLTLNSPTGKKIKSREGLRRCESRPSVSCKKNGMAAQSGKMRKFELSDPQRTGIHGECDLKHGDHLLQGSCDLLE